MLIDQVEAKDKLSQNRTPQDRANVIVALRNEPDPEAHEIAGLMAQREALAERPTEQREALAERST
jgi:predicted FMN-binding regulatory protein PaiB